MRRIRTHIITREGANGVEDGIGVGGGNVDGAGTRMGSGRAEERRRSARNRTNVVHTMCETGETCVERGKT